MCSKILPKHTLRSWKKSVRVVGEKKDDLTKYASFNISSVPLPGSASTDRGGKKDASTFPFYDQW